MEIESVKIKLALLWLSYFCAMIVLPTLDLYRPGIIEEIIAGEGVPGGEPMAAGWILFIAIIMLIPPVMAVVSITLKDKANRWANIIVGIVVAGLSFANPVEFLIEPSAEAAYHILIAIVNVVITVLIVWYALKWPKQEG